MPQTFYLNTPAKIELRAGRMRKDAVYVGHYRDSKGDEIDVTRPRIEHWSQCLREMREAGVQISMPIDHSKKSIDNVGFVEALIPAGDKMDFECEISEVPNAALIGTSIREVSIRVEPEFIDQRTGKRWEDVITHISPCTDPVVSGQENFIALRRTAGGSTPKGVSNLRTGGNKMDELMALLQGDAGKALAQSAGVDLADLTAENVAAKVAAILGVCIKAAGDGAAANLRREAKETPREIELRTRAELAESEAAELRSGSVDAEIDGWLKSGRIVAAKVPHARAILLGGGAVSLSRKDDKGVVTQTSAAADLREIINAIPEGGVIELGKRTAGGKPVPTPTDGDGADPSRKALAKAARELADKEKIDYAVALRRVAGEQSAEGGDDEDDE